MIKISSKDFETQNNFEKTKQITSISVFEAKLNFTPKITIAIPTYKRAGFLKEAVDSAINQIGYDEYEIIVLDNNPERDCETEQLMVSYNNPRISYYKNEKNIGMYGNWNRCVELSKGEYLTILNDDDLLDLNYLRRVNSFVNLCGNVNVLLVGFVIFPQDSAPIEKNEKYINKANIITLLFGNINPGSLGVLIKKNILIDLGGFNDVLFPISDYAIWINILTNYKNVFIISEKLAYYRMAVNESLKIETQENNIFYTDILRNKLATKFKNLKILIDIALPAFSYVYFKRVSEYSFDFKIKYADKLSEVKSNVTYLSYICYYILIVIRKIQNRYSKIALFRLSRKYYD